MPAPFIDFTENDLVESVDDVSPAESWSKREIAAPKIYQVPWAKVPSAIAFFLGIEYQRNAANTTPPAPADNLLSRTLPMQHPRWSYLYAQRVTEKKGVKVVGKEIASLAGGVFNRPYPNAKYATEDIQVEFGQHTVRYLTDLQVTGTVDIWQQSLTRALYQPPAQREWLRWCSYPTKPYSDFDEVEGQSFSYCEGPGGPQGGKPGLSVKGGVGLPVSKLGLAIKWHNVPHEYLFESQGDGGPGVPWNLLAGMNKVNAYPFLGYPAGTLLCNDPPEIEDYPSPVQFGPVPQLLHDVTFSFKFFDPPRGNRASTFRGWQTEQYYPDRQFYGVTRNPLVGASGDPANPRKFDEYPFASFFLPPVGQFLNWYTWRDRQP